MPESNQTLQTVMTVVIVAIALIIGAYVFGAVADTTPRNVEHQVTDESFDATANAWVALNHSYIISSSENITNSTGTVLTDSQYKMNYTDGSINVTDSAVIDNPMEISYDYKTHMAGFSSVVSNFGSAITLLAVGLIVLAAAFILGILINRFTRRQRR